MSVPHFDGDVELERFMKLGKVGWADEFTVTGPLGKEEPEKEELGKGEEKHQWQVLVSIWQTEEDVQVGGSSERVVARAMGSGGVGTNLEPPPGKWAARMVTLGDGEFKPGHTATGLAHFVENEGDPTEFQTYLWIQRLNIRFTPNDAPQT